MSLQAKLDTMREMLLRDLGNGAAAAYGSALALDADLDDRRRLEPGRAVVLAGLRGA